MLIPLAVAVALTLPALSVHVPDADCPAASALSVTGAEQTSTPDSSSDPMKLTVTSVLFQPFEFAAGVALALAVGSVLSMFKPLTVVLAEFPASSTAFPLADCPAPSPVRVVFGPQDATPERLSLHVNETVTSVLFQPFVFASG